MSYCKSINILNIISIYYLVCHASSAPVAVSGCYLLSPSSTVPFTPACIISYTYLYHHISYEFNYNMCYMLPCLSHLICSCCSIRLLSVVPFFNCFCYSCLHYISYICVCYRKLLYYITYHNTSYLFNHSMCCISYHHVTLCDLHPHPYYTIHHHQHSHQLTLKL